ncbi:MAG: type III pantothenate kinase [Saprospiraceae bacterium]|jgi:type III pantothenate kinase
MDLIIDIGNTRAKAGVFRAGNYIDVIIFDPDDGRALAEMTGRWKVRRMGVSCVRDEIPACVRELFEEMEYVLLIDRHTPVPIENAYTTPETLGSDRLAAVVGAWAEFAERPCLVIDAGTCITADLVDEWGVFRGGNISPGIDMRLRAMFELTARLPLVEKSPPESVLGQSTAEALNNGASGGAVFEMSALCRRLRKTWPDLQVVVTGGDADFFDKLTDTSVIRPHLVLTGLEKIVSYNAEQIH